jgi:amino-acid N-acetyltransferase
LIRIRKARMADVEKMQDLVNFHAKAGRMLARSLLELYENLRDFYVAAEGGRVVGAAALHTSWEDLAEVKSVAVADGRQGQGLGRKLVEHCLQEAASLGVPRVFVLTYVPGFFEKLGFQRIERSELPHRVWAECLRCPEFPDCGEIAMIREIPRKRRHAPRRGRPARARKGSRHG